MQRSPPLPNEPPGMNCVPVVAGSAPCCSLSMICRTQRPPFCLQVTSQLLSGCRTHLDCTASVAPACSADGLKEVCLSCGDRDGALPAGVERTRILGGSISCAAAASLVHEAGCQRQQHLAVIRVAAHDSISSNGWQQHTTGQSSLPTCHTLRLQTSDACCATQAHMHVLPLCWPPT